MKLNNFFDVTRRRRGVFETKRGVIFETRAGNYFRLKTRSLRAFVSEPAKKKLLYLRV